MNNWLELITDSISVGEWVRWKEVFPELELVGNGKFFNIYATPIRGPLTPLQQTALLTARSFCLKIDSTEWEQPGQGERRG